MEENGPQVLLSICLSHSFFFTKVFLQRNCEMVENSNLNSMFYRLLYASETQVILWGPRLNQGPRPESLERIFLKSKHRGIDVV